MFMPHWGKCICQKDMKELKTAFLALCLPESFTISKDSFYFWDLDWGELNGQNVHWTTNYYSEYSEEYKFSVKHLPEKVK